MVIQKSPRTGYGVCVSRWLDRQFSDHWIGLCLSVEWPSKSPHLMPLDFLLVEAFEGHDVPGENTKCGPQFKALEMLTQTY